MHKILKILFVLNVLPIFIILLQCLCEHVIRFGALDLYTPLEGKGHNILLPLRIIWNYYRNSCQIQILKRGEKDPVTPHFIYLHYFPYLEKKIDAIINEGGAHVSSQNENCLDDIAWSPFVSANSVGCVFNCD